MPRLSRLSLLLIACLALTALWLFTGWCFAYIGLRTPRFSFYLGANMGAIYVKAAANAAPSTWLIEPRIDQHSFDLPRWDWWFPMYSQQRTNALFHVIRIPLWPFIVSAAAAVMVLSARQRRADRIARKVLCPRCQYPRAGIDPAAPCPECGQAPDG